MPIQVSCPDCCTQFSVPDQLAGKKATCPRCGGKALVTGTPTAELPPPPPPPKLRPSAKDDRVTDRPTKAPPRQAESTKAALLQADSPKPAPRQAASTTKTAPLPAEPAKPAPRQSQANTKGPRQSDTITTAPRPEPLAAGRRRPEPAPAKTGKPEAVTEIPEAEPDEPEPGDPDAKPRKKKKRRKKKQAESGSQPLLLWIATGGVASLLLVGMLLVMLVGMKEEAIYFCIGLAIMLPISVGILIGSMFICSALAGGIDFGDARIVIPKAAALLLVMNTLGAICGGGFNLTYSGARYGYAAMLPFWLIGLMWLFRLDLWEARMLTAVNWGFNFVIKIFVTTMLFSAMQHAATHDGQLMPGGADDPPVLSLDEAHDHAKIDAGQNAAIAKIKKLGGKVVYGVGEDSDVIVAIDLSGTKVKDKDLTVLQYFTEVVSIDLSHTSVGDDGLTHLLGHRKLGEVNLTDTDVSKIGVQWLQVRYPFIRVHYPEH